MQQLEIAWSLITRMQLSAQLTSMRVPLRPWDIVRKALVKMRSPLVKTQEQLQVTLESVAELLTKRKRSLRNSWMTVEPGSREYLLSSLGSSTSVQSTQWTLWSLERASSMRLSKLAENTAILVKPLASQLLRQRRSSAPLIQTLCTPANSSRMQIWPRYTLISAILSLGSPRKDLSMTPTTQGLAGSCIMITSTQVLSRLPSLILSAVYVLRTKVWPFSASWQTSSLRLAMESKGTYISVGSSLVFLPSLIWKQQKRFWQIWPLELGMVFFWAQSTTMVLERGRRMLSQQVVLVRFQTVMQLFITGTVLLSERIPQCTSDLSPFYVSAMNCCPHELPILATWILLRPCRATSGYSSFWSPILLVSLMYFWRSASEEQLNLRLQPVKRLPMSRQQASLGVRGRILQKLLVWQLGSEIPVTAPTRTLRQRILRSGVRGWDVCWLRSIID